MDYPSQFFSHAQCLFLGSQCFSFSDGNFPNQFCCLIANDNFPPRYIASPYLSRHLRSLFCTELKTDFCSLKWLHRQQPHFHQTPIWQETHTVYSLTCLFYSTCSLAQASFEHCPPSRLSFSLPSGAECARNKEVSSSNLADSASKNPPENWWTLKQNLMASVHSMAHRQITLSEFNGNINQNHVNQTAGQFTQFLSGEAIHSCDEGCIQWTIIDSAQCSSNSTKEGAELPTECSSEQLTSFEWSH